MQSRSSYEDLFKRTYPKLFFYVKGIVGNDADAEDAVEEVFADLWRRRDDVEWCDKLEAYLYRAVLSRAINILHKANHSEEQLSLLIAINDRRMAYLESEWGNPQHDVEMADIRQAIEEAVMELPERCRQVFQMSYIDGLGHQEIAGKLGISVRTVEVHIYNALRMLRKKLDGKRNLLSIILCCL